MEKLGYVLGMLLCIEAATFGHFEHRERQLKAFPLHQAWSVRLAAFGSGLGPMTEESSSTPDAATDDASPDYGPCGGPGLALACAP